MNDLISVIVPVFNKEQSVRKALLSLKEQTYHNLQVIVIDDGSTDCSSTIINKICSEDDRFQSYYQNNLGVSAARNLGLQKVDGKYVSFLDADDFLEPDYIEQLYKYHEFPLVATGFTQIGEKSKVVPADNRLVDENEIEHFVFKKTNFRYMCVVWAKLFQYSYIKENGLKFDESTSIGEDSIFLIQYLKACKKMYVLDIKGYNNVVSQGTLSRGNIQNFWNANQKLIRIVQDSFQVSYNETWAFLYLRGMKILLGNNIKDYSSFRDTFKSLKSKGDTKKLSFNLLKDRTDKVIFVLIKLNCSLTLYFLLKTLS